MGLLIDGTWHDRGYDTEKTKGKFERKASQFRSWVTADGTAGPSGQSGFKAEAGRYVLYVGLACPWAHRTMIFRRLKGLEHMIEMAVVHWLTDAQGWTFEAGPGVVPDPVSGVDFLHQVYTRADPDYTGRVTVPTLWDRETNTIVNNESSEIIRMFNSAFDGIGASDGDYYPAALRDEIDAVNERVYETLNNGVYRCGFATSQQAYDEAVTPLFETMDWLEDRLAGQRYLAGNRITEADWRLLTTLLRFDAVYHGHFKCNRRRLADYANLWGYTRDLYQQPMVADTVNMEHITKHYYQSHTTVNPTRIVPIGPMLDFSAPHDRAK